MPDFKEFSSGFSSVLEVSKDAASLATFWLLFVGAGAGIGFLFGRGKLGNVFIDVYIAFAVSTAVVSFLPAPGFPLFGAIVFLVLLAFLIGIDRYLFDLHISSSAYDIFWRVLVMGVLVTGMILSVLVSSLPESALPKSVIAPLLAYFGSPLSRVLWLSVPVLVLSFMNRRLGR